MLDTWKLIRISILASWSFLTVGILLGSWWAYHELGWGGWWFWDPVENASLMPWLLATACIHSVTQPRLKSWTIFCGIGTFFLSILGTFFVRSGLLASVHSFATDSTRGLFLLLFLLCITAVSVLCWTSSFRNQSNKRSPSGADRSNLAGALGRPFEPPLTSNQARETDKTKVALANESSRTVASANAPRKRPHRTASSLGRQVKSRREAAGFSGREGREFTSAEGPQEQFKRPIEQILHLQNLFFCIICIVVLCGTSAPILFQWLWNRDVGTGAPFYNAILSPLFTSVLFVLVYAHYMILPVAKATSKQPGGAWARIFERPSWLRTIARGATVRSGGRLFAGCLQALAAGLRQAASGRSLATILLKQPNLINCKQPPIVGRLVRAAFGRLVLLYSLFFILHVLCLHFIFELYYLDSIYGAICFLLICNFIAGATIKKNRILARVYDRGREMNPLRGLPSRLIDWRTRPTEGRDFSEMKIAHTGIVLFITGAIASAAFKIQFTQQMHSGSMIRLGRSICCLRSIDHCFGPTYHSICANLLVYQPCPDKPPIACFSNFVSHPSKRSQATSLLSPLRAFGRPSITQPWHARFVPGKSPAGPAGPGQAGLSMFPEKRFYFSNAELTTTKVAIHTNLFTDFYGLIGTGSFETGWYTTIMKLPFIFCIWLGFLFGGLSGVFSLKKQLQKFKLKWV